MPPTVIKCSTEWHSTLAPWQEARWCRRLEASLPAMTLGGRAMDANQGRALQQRSQQWSLPAHALCMPGYSRRLRLACHMDGLHLCIRRFLHAHLTSAYRLEALNGLHTMACMRACVLVALPARFSRGCSCAARWLVPFMVSTRMCRAAGTRAVCVKVSMQCPLYITRDP